MIKKLETSSEANKNKTVGEKLADFRNKINEIIIYLNKKEEKEYSKQVENYLTELIDDIE